MVTRPRLLSVGDRVRFSGRERTVAALSGSLVQLVDDAQDVAVVLLPRLLTAEDFEILSAVPGRPMVSASDLLDGLPEAVVERAEWWQEHLVEMLTGRSLADPDMPMREEYDPAVRSLRQRELAKVAELRDGGLTVSLSWVQQLRTRFEAKGLAGLVDGRWQLRPQVTGRVDPRVVTALEQVVADQAERSTVSGAVLRHRMERVLEKEHGRGVVPLPSRATFYRLLSAIGSGRHTLGSARTRRSLAKRPDRTFGQLIAARPGEVMEIDSTPLDVLVVHDDGTVDSCELTGLVDLATRTLASAVLRPSTKAVDAALLLARAMTPEPMRPGWPEALRMTRSVLPHASLLDVDARLAQAAAVPVITPETIVCDRGRAFLSDTFRRACHTLEISLQPAHPDTPTDKPHIERTLGSVASMFAQFLPGHKGRSTEHRGKEPEQQAVWSIHQIQALLEEWIVARWQTRPHDGLRDPLMPGRPLSPNEKYAALVAAAGHVPVTLSPTEYIELLPSTRRTLNAYGFKISHRIYDGPDLGDLRREYSGSGPDGRRWQVHYDPYDISRIWVRHPRTQDWVTVFWRHLRTAPVPMGELAWGHARKVLAERGASGAGEEEIARAAAELLERMAAGPDTPLQDHPKRAASRQRSRRVAARTRATTDPAYPRPPAIAPAEEDEQAQEPEAPEKVADVIPLGLFDPLEDPWRRS
ncbi:Mu transposase C-terminal domain-containing protein [Streptomyces yerevanensis]|uniref:Mu transposase C-terminal domain-containing protein n=1 Tax=Streptomyces yerevanensis TaxID=66378 RepID=UPI0005273E42|nr:Mu transposase C-terminal domain-containing protein [Streptomyces yerevanensis]